MRNWFCEWSNYESNGKSILQLKQGEKKWLVVAESLQLGVDKKLIMEGVDIRIAPRTDE